MPFLKSMEIKIVNQSKHNLPEYQTIHSAGMDLRANITADIILRPLERVLVPTGLFIELPEGYEAQIRPRSGLALKKGITRITSYNVCYTKLLRVNDKEEGKGYEYDETGCVITILQYRNGDISVINNFY